MGSYEQGKDYVVDYLKNRFQKGATCLDVGACDGVWKRKTGDLFVMDAVEVFEPNAKTLEGYRTVFHTDIRGFKYVYYDCIIFGDVIEHMEVEEAQEVLRYANDRCEDMIIGKMMDDWRLVSEVGNPKEPGEYPCVLIFDEWYNGEPTGRKLATIDDRYFGEAERFSGWIMKDQPKKGLVWTEQTGSWPNERVYAWMPFAEYKRIPLPDGVTWEAES